MKAAFLAALLIAVSPEAALAHGGVSHETVLVQVEGNEAQLSPAVERHAWSPVCPPGSGHICGCDNLSLGDDVGKPPPVVRCDVSFLLQHSSAAAPACDAPARCAPRFAAASPRAPPFPG